MSKLTERQREVLHLIAQGYTHREIAGKLYVSLQAIRLHSKNIQRRLNAANSPAAVVVALKTGEIEMPESVVGK